MINLSLSLHLDFVTWALMFLCEQNSKETSQKIVPLLIK